MSTRTQSDLFWINPLGTSFRETILFEWDQSRYDEWRQQGYDVVYPTDTEEVVARLIRLYLLRVGRLFNERKSWRIIQDLNNLLVYKSRGYLPAMVERMRHDIRVIRGIDRNGMLAEDLGMLEEAIEIYEKTYFYRIGLRDEVLPIPFYQYREYSNSSVQVICAIGLITTVSFLISMLKVVMERRTDIAKEREIRAVRRSPVYRHLETFLALDDRQSIDTYMSNARNIHTPRTGQDAFHKTFFLFQDVERTPEDTPSADDLSILRSILGQETQITYLGFIGVFFHVYVAHFMMKYIESIWLDAIEGRAAGGDVGLGREVCEVSREDGPASFDEYFAVTRTDIPVEVGRQYAQEMRETERARGMLGLVKDRGDF